jgi:hypothetical protein
MAERADMSGASRHARPGFTYKAWQVGISSYFLASASTPMRAIITGVVVLLAIAGLVNAQDRRLRTNFDGLRDYHDLTTTGMANAAANGFIDAVCQGHRLPTVLVRGAFNIVTNVSMSWEEYQYTHGQDGEWSKAKAMYPWSVVDGYCHTVLNNTWVTDRDVDYGPWVDNTSKLSAQRFPMVMDFVLPPATHFTTLPSWIPESIEFIGQNFFLSAKPQAAAIVFVHSINWNHLPQRIPAIDDILIDACTQARFTAVSVTRTVVGMQAFEIKEYYFARREKQDIGIGTAPGDLRWQTVQMEKWDHWVDLRQEESGWVSWTPSPDSWSNVYSGDGYVRADGAGRLTPQGTMNVQVESRALPPEQCA